MPLNDTIDGVNAISNVSGSATGWVVTVGLFIATLLTLFFLSKNFRQFIIGGVVTIILLVNYKLSRYVGTTTTEENYVPVKWAAYIIGFILVSIVIGKLIRKTKIYQKLENSILKATKD